MFTLIFAENINKLISISALFIMTIGLKKFSCRTTIIFGGLCIVSSYILTAFTTNINVFYFVQGVIGGILESLGFSSFSFLSVCLSICPSDYPSCGMSRFPSDRLTIFPNSCIDIFSKLTILPKFLSYIPLMLSLELTCHRILSGPNVENSCT